MSHAHLYTEWINLGSSLSKDYNLHFFYSVQLRREKSFLVLVIKRFQKLRVWEIGYSWIVHCICVKISLGQNHWLWKRVSTVCCLSCKSDSLSIKIFAQWLLLKRRQNATQKRNIGIELWEAQWPHGQCARLRIERSGFEPWPGTLCCVLGQDTYSQCLSTPRCINGYRWIYCWVVTLRWTSIPSRGE